MNASADGVLGQTLFTTSATAATASSVATPAQLFPDAAGRLWVADYGHNRVLRFDGATALANGSAATVALGQPDLTTVTSGLSSTKMNGPAGVYFDAQGNLWVAELSNKRVLRFAAAASLPTGSGANLVLGQPNFTTAGPRPARRRSPLPGTSPPAQMAASSSATPARTGCSASARSRLPALRRIRASSSPARKFTPPPLPACSCTGARLMPEARFPACR